MLQSANPLIDDQLGILDSERRSLASRVSVGLRILIGVNLTFAVLDLVRYRGSIPLLHVVQVSLITLGLCGLRILPKLETIQSIKLLAISLFAVVCATVPIASVAQSAADGQPILLVSITLAAATSIPWGTRAQCVAVLSAILALLANSVWITDGLILPDATQLISFAIVLAATIVVAEAIEQQRIAQQAAEVQRRSSERRYLLLAESTSAVPWEADFRTHQFTYVGPQVQQLLGFPAVDWCALDFWPTRIHPQDRDWVLAEWREKSRRESGFELEYRMLAKDGRVIWIHDVASVEVAPSGPMRLRGFLLDITEHRRVEQHKSALLAVARELASTAEPQAILDGTARHAVQALACDAVVIFRWLSKEQLFGVVSHHGIPPSLVDGTMQLRFGKRKPFGGRVSAGETLVVNDITEFEALPIGYLETARATRLLVSPLRIGGEDDGRLVAIRRGGSEFSADDAVLIEGIARQLAGALERAQLQSAKLENAKVSVALAELSRGLMSTSGTLPLCAELCRHAVEIFKAKASYVWLREAGDESYQAVACFGDSPEMWEAVRSLRITQIDDYIRRLGRASFLVGEGDSMQSLLQGELATRQGVRRLIHIALQSGEEVFGVLTISFVDVVEPWSSFHERLVNGVANIAALAIEKARLLDALERANRVKSDFMATMSHELRTPLNVIMGYGDLLLDDVFGPVNQEQRDTIKRMMTHSSSLFEMIDQTLDIGRLEARPRSIEIGTRGIGEFLEELDHETHELQAKPGLVVRWSVDNDLPMVTTDFAKLKVAVRNLVHNAIKFTPSGEVEVRADSSRGGIEISVRDTGVGIPAEARDLIFEAFRQVDASFTSRFSGVGLGLYITSQLTTLLGGTIGVESELGKGSTFSLWIPLIHPIAAEEAAIELADSVGRSAATGNH